MLQLPSIRARTEQVQSSGPLCQMRRRPPIEGMPEGAHRPGQVRKLRRGAPGQLPPVPKKPQPEEDTGANRTSSTENGHQRSEDICGRHLISDNDATADEGTREEDSPAAPEEGRADHQPVPEDDDAATPVADRLRDERPEGNAEEDSPVDETTGAELKILSWNANGLYRRRRELEELLQREHIDIALICETHFRECHSTKIANYEGYVDNRTDRLGGGTAIYVKRTLPHSRVETPPLETTEATIVSVSTTDNNNIKFVSAYRPPGRRLVWRDMRDLMELDGGTTVLAGDLNAKHRNWGCRGTNRDGIVLQDYLDNGASEIRAPAVPTRIDPAGRASEILDVVLVRAVDVEDGEPKVLDELSSDHNPILFHIKNGPPSRAKFTKKLTNWPKFQEKFLEQLPSEFNIETPEDLDLTVQSLTDTYDRSLQESTSTVQIPLTHYHVIPNHIRAVIRERRRAKRVYSRTLNPADRRVLDGLNAEVRQELQHFHSWKWQQHLDSLDVRDNSLWRTIRALTRKRSLIPAIQGRLGTAYSEEEKAEAFGDS